MLSRSEKSQKRMPTGCLIIEDSEFDRLKLSRVVMRNKPDLEIELVTTLRTAREALEKGGTALILLDNNLPDGLGADFAVELSQDPQLSAIPIIMISDWPSPFMWQKAASAGVSYVLSKSEFDGRYLFAALEAKPKMRQLT